MLDENPLRAWYGESHVFKAAERGAIGKLLVSDELFRSVPLLTPLRPFPTGFVSDALTAPGPFDLDSAPSVARRKRFVKLVEDVKAYGGEVLMFSSMHESGQRELFSSTTSSLSSAHTPAPVSFDQC